MQTIKLVSASLSVEARLPDSAVLRLLTYELYNTLCVLGNSTHCRFRAKVSGREYACDPVLLSRESKWIERVLMNLSHYYEENELDEIQRVQAPLGKFVISSGTDVYVLTFPWTLEVGFVLSCLVEDSTALGNDDWASVAIRMGDDEWASGHLNLNHRFNLGSMISTLVRHANGKPKDNGSLSQYLVSE